MSFFIPYFFNFFWHVLPKSALQKMLRLLSASVSSQTQKKICIDVSIIIKNDAKTGIQRVVRCIVDKILENDIDGYEIDLCFGYKKNDYRVLSKEEWYEKKIKSHSHPKVKLSCNDIFFALDLTSRILPKNRLIFLKWKLAGVRIIVSVYDILPVTFPEYFERKSRKFFSRWLNFISVIADLIICNSNTVKQELDNWLGDKFSMLHSNIKVLPLGADFSSNRDFFCPEGKFLYYEKLKSKSYFLIVGTVEPRKGHKDILDAFEVLWAQGFEYELVFVGKKGWKTEVLQKRIKNHPKIGRGFFWFENISDAELILIYENSVGVIVPSYAEGFGLPLVEASLYRRPILARDIAIFKEVGLPYTTFFSSDSSTLNLASQIRFWAENNKTEVSAEFCQSLFTWDMTVRLLIKIIRDESNKGFAN
jgi:glycosyltransferase involved in cell wall biosynthesis